MPLFVSDARGAGVAGYDQRVVGQGIEFLDDVVQQILMVAAREIGAADAFVKQYVSCQQQFRFGAVEHHVARGVAGNVQHVETVTPDCQHVALLQPAVGLKGGADGKAV